MKTANYNVTKFSSTKEETALQLIEPHLTKHSNSLLDLVIQDGQPMAQKQIQTLILIQAPMDILQ